MIELCDRHDRVADAIGRLLGLQLREFIIVADWRAHYQFCATERLGNLCPIPVP